MTIPDFQTVMLPLLRLMNDDKEHFNHDTEILLAKEFKLTSPELDELLPSGKQTIFSNRVGWARTHLSKAGLIKAPRRSYYQITDRGKYVLKKNPSRVDMSLLSQFPEYQEFREHKPKSPSPIPPPVIIDARTPEEILEDTFQDIRESIMQDLLANIKTCSPSFFERLVVELLVKMGYGGSRKDAARAVGQSGDGGIDGIIDEDRLGLDVLYIQAKRWEGVVGRPEIQKFIGALMGKKAKKGIFITNSNFSSEATNFISAIEYKIVLIDGKRLAELMIDYDIGVSEVSTYKLKRIDSDYFGNN
jgi:restriction system protein